MSNRALLFSIGVILSSAFLAACGGGSSSSSGGSGGATGGSTTTTSSSSGGAGTGGMSTGGMSTGGTTTGSSTFGDYHAGWLATWPTTGQDLPIGKIHAGGAIVAGSFEGDITLGAKQLSAPGGVIEGYVVNMYPGGQIAWSTFIESTETVGVTSVDVDQAGNVLVSGSFSGTLTLDGAVQGPFPVPVGFVAYLDSFGKLKWIRTVGDGVIAADVTTAAFAPDGDVLIAGDFQSAIDLNGTVLQPIGGGDFYVAKIAKAGLPIQWSKAYGGADVEILLSASVDAAGDVVLSGVYSGDMMLGDLTLPPGPIDGYGFFAKVSGSDGKAIFARELGAALGNVAAAPDGAYFSGILKGDADFGGGTVSSPAWVPVVAAYDLTGKYRWSNMYGDAGTDASGITLPSATASGLLAGWPVDGTFDYGDGKGQVQAMGGPDMSLAAFPPDNTPPRRFHFGGDGFQAPTSVSLGADGSALVVGFYTGTFDVGPVDTGSGTITALSESDAFVLFLAPKGP